MRRFLLLTSVVHMLIGSMWGQSAMAPTAGNGSESNPYQIATLENLYWLSRNSDVWDRYFIQTANIDASETSGWDEGDGFSPIGTSTDKFEGAYNGAGHFIDGVFVNRPMDDCVGVFGFTYGAKIDSLGVVNCSVTGNTYVGGLVGCMQNVSVVSQCYTGGFVSGKSGVGGLVGKNSLTSIISYCYSNAAVSTDSYAGGLVGVNNMSSVIYQSYCFGDVSGNSNTGGLLGRNFGSSKITDCFYNAELSGQNAGIGEDDNEQYVAGLTSLEMQMFFLFAGWDFAGLVRDGSDDMWAITTDVNNGFPVLLWQLDLAEPVLGSVSSEIDGSIVTLNSNFLSLGVPNPVAYGFCYSNSEINPGVLSDDTTCIGAVNGYESPGNFTDELTDIDASETYYVRAYAINAADTVYTNNVAIINDPKTYIIGNVDDESFRVYPNPTTSVLYVNGSVGKVRMYDVFGNLVLTYDLSQSNSMDLSTLQPGMYILCVDDEIVRVIKR